MSAPASLFHKPISDRDRGFLRRVADADGWHDIADGETPSAVQCKLAGYVTLSSNRRSAIISENVSAYLRQMMGVH